MRAAMIELVMWLTVQRWAASRLGRVLRVVPDSRTTSWRYARRSSCVSWPPERVQRMIGVRDGEKRMRASGSPRKPDGHHRRDREIHLPFGERFGRSAENRFDRARSGCAGFRR